MLLSIRNYYKDCVCHPICSMVMIGDGATDMEASPPAVSHYVLFPRARVYTYYSVKVAMDD